ncbi:Unannotated [Lentimonas sp. CC19]|nr:Unannotated [Lentimonas sp. CC10]CAA6696839.1 Unannotated [Lentimonas sp. CC19]CAA7071194.1 Unannotated [Lentimonas sp. CC11]
MMSGDKRFERSDSGDRFSVFLDFRFSVFLNFSVSAFPCFSISDNFWSIFGLIEETGAAECGHDDGHELLHAALPGA